MSGLMKKVTSNTCRDVSLVLISMKGSQDPGTRSSEWIPSISIDVKTSLKLTKRLAVLCRRSIAIDLSLLVRHF